MQFHHHGYISGNPRVLPRIEGTNTGSELPSQVDVLIVGAGPAGMLAAAQLSMFPDISTVLVEKRSGRLVIGQADGIQRRAVEMFQAFGFAQEIMAEAFDIVELTFWKPDPEDPSKIVRTARTPDDPVGLSEWPHIICNQARVLDYFAKFMRQSPTRREPIWGVEFDSLEITDGEYPVKAKLRRVTEDNPDGELIDIEAKYVLGADGARSAVRKSIGAVPSGTVGNHAWGVMDVLGNTDFPDIRTKAVVNATAGSVLNIPREGGYMFRNYVDLGPVPEGGSKTVRATPLEKIVEKANEILSPYTITPKDVPWWSVYEVGHRVTDRFDDVPLEERGSRHPRVFIAGDACHTHTAKAGQGMNVSMQDGFNLAWKLAQVLRGLSDPSLLATYDVERKAIAEALIAFDRDWSSRFVSDTDGEKIEDHFVKTAEFPAGFMTEYEHSRLTGDTGQELATGYPLGKRFWSHPVRRHCDTVQVELGHSHRADGRWRVYVFADRGGAKAQAFSDWFLSEEGPVRLYGGKDAEQSALFDAKVIYQEPYSEIEAAQVPAAFRPLVGPLELENRELVFTADAEKGDIFDERGVSRDGVVIVVRPDMYVGHISALDDTESLQDYLAGIFLPQE